MSNDNPHGNESLASVPADWSIGAPVASSPDDEGALEVVQLTEFTEEREGDTVMALDGFKVFLDRKSTIYLSGIVLDFQSGLNGRGFVFDNPQASNTCGCGESFSL